MNRLSQIKKAIYCAVCIALCVVLPQAFHAIPNAGAIWCPMHIPVLLCGLICGPWYGILCGLAGPLLSSLFTGMPAAAVLPVMMIECFFYGFVSGFTMKAVRTNNTVADLYISLIAAMVIGRIVGGLSKAFIFSGGNYSLSVWATSYFVTALPGIILQLVLVPIIVVALIKCGLVPFRYFSKK